MLLAVVRRADSVARLLIDEMSWRIATPKSANGDGDDELNDTKSFTLVHC